MKSYSRHLLFCTGGDCEGKSLIKEARKLLGKDAVHIKRSKVGCLGACKSGPIMIVYPDGVWYRCPNKKVLRKIIEEHIQCDRPLEQYIIQQMQPPTVAATG
jgi:(2Fe-2S) ferredoxin